jgi:uncharacterized protein YqjF (DUF2071 family)
MATRATLANFRAMSDAPPFLTAEWRHLVMLNWRVDADLLAPRVPAGTTLDAWEGSHYVSLVGFLFLRTRVLGVSIPFHRDFEEINLRFYVRRTIGAEVRRGVCFIRELVPRAAIALTARVAYNEPYVAVPMTHRIEPSVEAPHADRVEYAWRMRGEQTRIEARPTGVPASLVPGSHEEFITEHYWGYTRQRKGGTIEYHVVHVPWKVRRIVSPIIDGDPAATYGPVFGAILQRAPDSAFLANGSPVAVHWPVPIAAT